MVDLPDDISSLVLSPNYKRDAAEISLDGQSLAVLMELDGKKQLSAVGKTLNVDMGVIRGAVSKLLELELAKIVEKSVPPEFVDFLIRELSKAAGPIAEVLVEDVATELGMDALRIPLHRVAELVDALSRHIPSDERKRAFTEAMLERLKQIES